MGVDVTTADEPIERFSLVSANPAEARIALLREHFPEVFDDGAIDWEDLQRIVGEWVEPGVEGFGLHWPGKAESHRTMQEPSLGALIPALDRSVDWDMTQHVVVEGGESRDAETPAAQLPRKGEARLHRSAVQHWQRLHLSR